MDDNVDLMKYINRGRNNGRNNIKGAVSDLQTGIFSHYISQLKGASQTALMVQSVIRK